MTRIPDYLAGPWQAYLLDEDGYAYRTINEAEADNGPDGEYQVVIVRRSAMPDPDRDMRMPGTTIPGDLIWVVQDELPLVADDTYEMAGVHLARAKAMATGLNAVSGAGQ